MDQNLILLVAIGVVSLIIGVILDNIAHMLFGKKEAAAQRPVAEVPLVTLEQPLSTPESPPDEGVNQTRSSDETLQYVDIVRVGRDLTHPQLVLRLEGGYYRSAQELSEEQRNKLIPVIEELTWWFKRQTPAPVPPPSTQLPVGKPVAKQEKDKNKTTTVAEKSIALQVDEILQEKLKGTALEKRGIFISETPEGGLLIHVGLEQFESVEAVPYAEIKGLIRTAVAEWGSRNLNR